MPNNHPFPPNSKICAYLRDSGGDEQELSVSQQEQEIRRWCLDNNLILTHIFADEARSGSSTVGRTQFQAMMHHFRDGPEETGVIIWSFSRFSRDIDDSQLYRAELRKLGYTLHSITDNIPGGIDGRVFEAMIDWKNEKYLQDLSRDVKRGQQHVIQQYGAIGGTPPKGFKTQNVEIGYRRDGTPHTVQKWVPDPEVWELCKLAWQMRSSGASYNEINKITHLFRAINSYSTFFKNKIYLGIMEFGDLTIEDYCEPMIDQKTWETVQNMRKTNHPSHLTGENNINHPRRKNSAYILTGLVKCAKCGSAMNGCTAHIKGEKYLYYECSAKRRNKSCNARKIPKNTLENAIIDTIADYILHPNTLEAIHAQNQQNSQQTDQQTKAQLTALNQQLGTTKRKIDNLTEAITEFGASGTKGRTLFQKLTELEQTETEITTQIAQLKTEINTTQLAIEEIKEIANDIANNIKEAPFKKQQRLIRGIINKVVVERVENKIIGIIHYYYPPPPPDNKKDTNDDNNGPFVSTTQCPRGGTIHTYKIIIDIPSRSRRPRPAPEAKPTTAYPYLPCLETRKKTRPDLKQHPQPSSSRPLRPHH